MGKVPWRRKQQSTAVFLPGKSYGLKSLVSYSPWGHKELDTIVTKDKAPQGSSCKFNGTALPPIPWYISSVAPITPKFPNLFAHFLSNSPYWSQRILMRVEISSALITAINPDQLRPQWGLSKYLVHQWMNDLMERLYEERLQSWTVWAESQLCRCQLCSQGNHTS